MKSKIAKKWCLPDTDRSPVWDPRVYDGVKFASVVTDVGSASVPSVPDGNGQIFVSVASYRDGDRCGETLKSIFENAKDPSRVFVGLVEQNAPDDTFCLEAYCKSYGFETHEKKTVREGVVKIMTKDQQRAKCPHYDQVRLVAFHHISAKGPIFARSLTKKALGNEEFCLQIDAHTTFIKNWDEEVITEWKKAKNEFGVISTVPAGKSDEGDSGQIPRQCKVKFRDNGFPDFESPADGYATEISEPLLSHAWSAAFSFAKCHLEESVPYDPFLSYAMPIEQFSRYARMWTRGYDTYTPSKNIVYHDYDGQTNGHGSNEWFKRQRDRFRKGSIERVKTALQLPGGQSSETEQANMGIFGLGKRRTLKQLAEFTGIDLDHRVGNDGTDCVKSALVPYDVSISPVENLYSNADNLDPQPEYPLRTALTYYEQVESIMPAIDVDLGSDSGQQQHQQVHPDSFAQQGDQVLLPPIPLLLLLWAFGLIIWYVMFISGGSSGSRPRKKRVGNSHKDV